MIGILWLLIKFHLDLRSIDKQPLMARYFKIFASHKFVLFFIVVTLVLTLTILNPLNPLNTKSLHLLHIKVILIMIFLFILMNKYYINQNLNLKLYVSVYHWQPPPVLPWQLPDNFDQNSVKLICVKGE